MEQLKRVRQQPRGAVLAVLSVITLAVATLSVAVTYDIIEPKFGLWAVPTVAALDALWLVFQATEILAGNNRPRAQRVQWAGMGLTLINAAIPTAHLIGAARGGAALGLAVVITPVAIIATKGAWWVVLPSLGRQVSDETRKGLATKRQDVADRLEEMEADAAHRIELLALATTLETQVAEAETDYRMAVLRAQQTMTEALHGQAEVTEKTTAEKPLPASVAAIRLPELGEWKPVAPALPGTLGGTLELTGADGGTQVSGGAAGSGTPGGTPTGTPGERVVTLADLAAVAGELVPQPGEQLTAGQLDVVLRHLRHSDDPPLSYRQARDAYRRAGFVGSEERIRTAWTALVAREGHGEMSETTDTEEESADADTDA
ncbi:hypothetical protein [Streptomyces salyersiae]|uniref:Protein spdB n=1 Tax=Streptomyces salyersiae TaxID=3075530 RepID=A0ABU2RZR7_9ACTN|nr:hypothetical protein [Streptomyces sp. DSM 41770]MDT0432899.1 hypothetical protein [Streptomyces sp. DSM 41770]